MKKNLAKAMAAAMTVGAVVPMATQAVNAAEPTLVRTVSDVRLATTGYKVNTTGSSVKVYTRTEAFNTNGTDQIGDDTLKSSLGKDARIIATYKGTAANLSDHRYVIASKANVADYNAAKYQLDTAKAEIAELKAKGYTITQKTVAKQSFDGTTFTESEVQVIASKSGVEYKFRFIGVDDVKYDETVGDLRNLFNGIDGVSSNALTLTFNTNDTDEDKYLTLNEVKYIIEKNKAKFDVDTEEFGASNENLLVTVNAAGIPGDDGKVFELTLNNFRNVDKDLVVSMPLTSDFSSHWAKAEIEEAMLKGWVDASSTFRPNAGVTRAEFAKMMCTMLGIEHDEDAIDDKIEPFSDVNSNQWYYEYVVALYNYIGDASIAKKGAVIGGYEDGTFKPNKAITREEAAKMIAAVYEIKTGDNLFVAYTSADGKNGFTSDYITTSATAGDGKIDITKTVNGQTLDRDIKTKFTDDKDIAAWADEAVAVLSQSSLSIIGGNPDGKFAPKSNITRAETLAMLKRAQQ